MKKIKTFFDLLPLLLMWLMVSVFLWGWIFTFLTDTAPENKIALFIDAPVPHAAELALLLEDAALSDEIRMVKVHPFTYAMMGGSGMENADLYIVSETAAQTYRDWFCPLPEAMRGLEGVLTVEGIPLGLRVWEQAAGLGVADACIAYDAPDAAGEDYYLFFGSDSLHVKTNDGAVDDLAVTYARHLLTID